ncbi:MAG TPA: phenylalanine--tRNA ligase subunit alpha [Candidatus Moranbacteria bacterium]|nr:phenylalanine--tRNA ligase subunit alpha [Candidatus Moranbacteria bacterium]
MLEQKILNIKIEALKAIKEARTTEQLSDLRVKYLGRKSELNEVLKGLKDMTPEEKKKVGPMANMVKQEIESGFQEAERLFRSKSFNFEAESIDITIPGKEIKQGHLHILSQIQNEIEDIFTSMGFEIADGPEVETEFYNFDALNIPKDHPARDLWDTFWIKSEGKERIALRPHTSPVQVRYMEKHRPPFRIIAPGKCFRNEATDATHEHSFYQFEALVVGEDINVGHFKFIGEQFFSKFFNRDIKIRLRPSFFPFVEPGFEFDISCTVCDGKGCKSCKGGGWLEIGGAGMVNQNVFAAAGYPKNKYQGFAWGFGLERLAMMKYKIDDIRLFHSGDLRFIKQF